MHMISRTGKNPVGKTCVRRDAPRSYFVHRKNSTQFYSENIGIRTHPSIDEKLKPTLTILRK